jgi:hypothetical protein
MSNLMRDLALAGGLTLTAMVAYFGASHLSGKDAYTGKPVEEQRREEDNPMKYVSAGLAFGTLLTGTYLMTRSKKNSQ